MTQREKEQRLSAYIDELNAGRQGKGSEELAETDEELRSLMDTTVRIRALKDAPALKASAAVRTARRERASKRPWLWSIATALLLALAAAGIAFMAWQPSIHAIIK